MVTAPPGWYPSGASREPRWWDGAAWTAHVARPGSVLDSSVVRVARSWGQRRMAITGPAGASLGEAYEKQEAVSVPVNLPATPRARTAQTPAVNPLRSGMRRSEVVVLDTAGNHLLAVKRLGEPPLVTITGPDGREAGEVRMTGDRSRMAIEVTLAGVPALRAAASTFDRKTRLVHFTVLSVAGRQVATLALAVSVDHRLPEDAATGPPAPRYLGAASPATRRPLAFEVSIAITTPQAAPVSGLLGTLPVALFPLMLPTLGMMSIQLPSASEVGRAALAGLSRAFLESLADLD